jgi:hypothetical protein
VLSKDFGELKKPDQIGGISGEGASPASGSGARLINSSGEGHWKKGRKGEEERKGKLLAAETDKNNSAGIDRMQRQVSADVATAATDTS